MTRIASLTANLGMNSAQYRQSMDKATNRTKRYRSEARRTADQTNKLRGTFRGAAQGVAAIDGPLGGVASRLGAVSGLANSNALGWAALGVSVAGATALIYKSVTAYERMERGQLRTQAVLQATGFTAGKTAEQLDEQARSLARATLAGVEGVRQAQQVMLTFRSVSGDVFDEAITLSQDLAAVMGTDVKTAALQLGKALELPSEGITALKRSGVSFSAAQKQVIKDLEETGQVAEAQRVVLATLQKQIGGVGAAEAGGLAGAVDSLGQSWEEMLEKIGKTSGVSEVVQSLFRNLEAGFLGIGNLIDPDETTLLRQRALDIADEIDALDRRLTSRRVGGRSGRISDQAREEMQARLASLKESQQVVNAAIVRGITETTQAELEAQGKAEAARAAATEEAAQGRLVKAQESGQKVLAALETSLASQEEKIALSHEKRLAQIASLQVSEQELVKRGFTEMAQLRAQLTEESEAQRAQQVFDLAQQRQQAEIDAVIAKERRITAVKKEELDKQIENEKTISEAKRELETSAFQFARSLTEKGSKANRALLIAEKLAGLARAKVALQVAIAKANAVGFPANIPAIAQAVSIGASAITTMKSVDIVAHGGMEFVPQDSTALLKKGERVLQPAQNVQLEKFMRKGGQAGGGSTAINVDIQAQMLDGGDFDTLVENAIPQIRQRLVELDAESGRGGGPL